VNTQVVGSASKPASSGWFGSILSAFPSEGPVARRAAATLGSSDRRSIRRHNPDVRQVMPSAPLRSWRGRTRAMTCGAQP